MKIRLLVLIIPILFSCKSILTKFNPKIGNSEYAILSFNPNEKYPIFANSKPTELTHEEILEIEKIIFFEISGYISQRVYHRQYVAAINEYGEKVIWINFLDAEDMDPNWNTYIVKVYDGGDSFFQLKVNLTKGTYYDFRVNSTA